MESVFQALANGHRRQILDILKGMPGCNVNDVCKYFGMSRIAVMKHLKILEEANLIVSKKVGRSRALYFNAVPIQLIYDRWTTEYSALWTTHATGVKFSSEATFAKKKKKENHAS